MYFDLTHILRPHLHGNAVKRKQRDFFLFQLTVYTRTMKTPGKRRLLKTKTKVETLKWRLRKRAFSLCKHPKTKQPSVVGQKSRGFIGQNGRAEGFHVDSVIITHTFLVNLVFLEPCRRTKTLHFKTKSLRFHLIALSCKRRLIVKCSTTNKPT